MTTRLNYITTDIIASWNPCLKNKFGEMDLERIDEYMDHEPRTPLEIATLGPSRVPELWVLWVLLRREVLDDLTYRLLACEYAEMVLPIYERRFPDDSRPRLAIETARRLALSGAEPTEAESAMLWDAYCAACFDATYAAAAQVAEREAAWGAANAAWSARMASWQTDALNTLASAANYAALAALEAGTHTATEMHRKQLDLLVRVLRGDVCLVTNAREEVAV